MTLAEHEKKNENREKPLTKVVIRRLPPQMTQEQFLHQVSPAPEYNYIYMVKGDLTLGENAFSRVYLNFVCPEDVYSFKERFDNYVFLDGKGHEYPAVVEFAPFQKIPKKRGKNRMDPKCNTIESDPYFLEFIASLNKTEEQEAKPEYTLQLTDKASDKNEETTPLLEYLKNKKAQKQKIREVRREERERKRREFDRKRDYKTYDVKKSDERATSSYGNKSFSSKSTPSKESIEVKEESKTPKATEKMSERPYSSTHRSKDQYLEKRKEIKPRFPKKEYPEYKKKDDFKDRNLKSKYSDDCKPEEKGFTKRVKKYSEKREERKIEAQKAEQRKLEQLKEEKEVPPEVATEEDITSTGNNEKDEKYKKETIVEEKRGKISDTNKEDDVDKDIEKNLDEKYESSSKRIRNKDRPTIAIYRPGMLSKRKPQTDEEPSKKNET